MLQVQALVAAVREHGLVLTLVPDHDRLRARSWRRIRWVDALGTDLVVPVDDEFSDADKASPALLLQLVLNTCEYYEECEDILEWATETELDVAEPWVLELYRTLGDVVPLVRAVVGPDLRALSPWDFSMNAGEAADLRAREG